MSLRSTGHEACPKGPSAAIEWMHGPQSLDMVGFLRPKYVDTINLDGLFGKGIERCSDVPGAFVRTGAFARPIGQMVQLPEGSLSHGPSSIHEAEKALYRLSLRRVFSLVWNIG